MTTAMHSPEQGDGPDEPVGEYAGINLYAKQAVHGRDRKQLEKLCRYITRPPVGNERLSQRDDGRLELELKNAWKDGTRVIVLESHDLITRLVAAVPPPRQHQVRASSEGSTRAGGGGVLASRSLLRGEIVPLLPDIEPTQQSEISCLWGWGMMRRRLRRAGS